MEVDIAEIAGTTEFMLVNGACFITAAVAVAMVSFRRMRFIRTARLAEGSQLLSSGLALGAASAPSQSR